MCTEAVQTADIGSNSLQKTNRRPKQFSWPWHVHIVSRVRVHFVSESHHKSLWSFFSAASQAVYQPMAQTCHKADPQTDRSHHSFPQHLHISSHSFLLWSFFFQAGNSKDKSKTVKPGHNTTSLIAEPWRWNQLGSLGVSLVQSSW